jgi:hypothetical protein
MGRDCASECVPIALAKADQRTPGLTRPAHRPETSDDGGPARSVFRRVRWSCSRSSCCRTGGSGDGLESGLGDSDAHHKRHLSCRGVTVMISCPCHSLRVHLPPWVVVAGRDPIPRGLMADVAIGRRAGRNALPRRAGQGDDDDRGAHGQARLCGARAWPRPLMEITLSLVLPST